MKRSFSTYIFLILRRLGLLKNKKYPQEKLTIKIQKSINSSGLDVDHKDFMVAKNALPKNYKNGKNRSLCQYDFIKHNCRCGIDLQQLKEGKKCKLENK